MRACSGINRRFICGIPLHPTWNLLRTPLVLPDLLSKSAIYCCYFTFSLHWFCFFFRVAGVRTRMLLGLSAVRQSLNRKRTAPIWMSTSERQRKRFGNVDDSTSATRTVHRVKNIESNTSESTPVHRISEILSAPNSNGSASNLSFQSVRERVAHRQPDARTRRDRAKEYQKLSDEAVLQLLSEVTLWKHETRRFWVERINRLTAEYNLRKDVTNERDLEILYREIRPFFSDSGIPEILQFIKNWRSDVEPLELTGINIILSCIKDQKDLPESNIPPSLITEFWRPDERFSIPPVALFFPNSILRCSHEVPLVDEKSMSILEAMPGAYWRPSIIDGTLIPLSSLYYGHSLVHYPSRFLLCSSDSATIDCYRSIIVLCNPLAFPIESSESNVMELPPSLQNLESEFDKTEDNFFDIIKRACGIKQQPELLVVAGLPIPLDSIAALNFN